MAHRDGVTGAADHFGCRIGQQGGSSAGGIHREHFALRAEHEVRGCRDRTELLVGEGLRSEQPRTVVARAYMARRISSRSSTSGLRSRRAAIRRERRGKHDANRHDMPQSMNFAMTARTSPAGSMRYSERTAPGRLVARLSARNPP